MAIGKTFSSDHLYEAGQEQVMERALSGLILNLHYYNGRILLYPDIADRIKEMSREQCFQGTLQDHSFADYQIAGDRKTQQKTSG